MSACAWATDGGPFSLAGSGQSRRRSHKPALSVQLGILLPSERSLAARHSAWDRDDACATHAAPTNLVFQSGVWLSQRSTGP